MDLYKYIVYLSNIFITGVYNCCIVIMASLCVSVAISGCDSNTSREAYCKSEHNGIIFRGNDVKPDKRTSVLIPGKKQILEFEDGLELSFDLKIRQKGDHYGNICTVVVDNEQYLSLILTNTRDISPALCIVSNKHSLVHLERLQTSVYDWQRVEISLVRHGDKVVIGENGDNLFELPAPRRQSRVQIFFGRSPLPEIQSIDVAPCELKNICLVRRLDEERQRRYEFALENTHNDSILYSNDGQLSAVVANQVWISDTHSQWHHVQTLSYNDRVFPTYNAVTGNLYLVTSGQVTRINLVNNRTRTWETSPQVLKSINNQFIAIGNSNNERLVFYDTDRGSPDPVIMFDAGRGDWERPLGTSRHLEYSHHNRACLEGDSSVIRLFGYGHHRYSAEIDRIDLYDNVISNVRLKGDTIPPRYMAATCMVDSLIYIYGGTGNMHGDQEYGTNVFDDLYTFNPLTMEVRRHWSHVSDSRRLVPAQTMVMHRDGGRAYVLMFSPFSSETYLSLKELDLSTGELYDKADSITYLFNDVKSWADLLALPSGEELFAVTVNYNHDKDNYEVKLYGISVPIIDNIGKIESRQSVSSSVIIYIAILLLGIAGVVVCMTLRRHRQKDVRSLTDCDYVDIIKPEEDVMADEDNGENPNVLKSENRSPGLYIIDDFMAVENNGSILTDQFSPILRQLLILITVYSIQRQNGISNSELKEYLWSDKSQDSFVNNRSVNIRKIRLLLEKIGGLDIVSSNGVWRLAASESNRVDFYDVMSALDECDKMSVISNELVDKIVRYARLGPLFPYMQHYWLDSIKARYSDRMIGVLHRILDDMSGLSDTKRQIMICDALLSFDSIDEKAVRAKCIALIKTKRIGIAHSSFRQFVREYETMMNETWIESFEQFIKH